MKSARQPVLSRESDRFGFLSLRDLKLSLQTGQVTFTVPFAGSTLAPELQTYPCQVRCSDSRIVDNRRWLREFSG